MYKLIDTHWLQSVFWFQGVQGKEKGKHKRSYTDALSDLTGHILKNSKAGTVENTDNIEYSELLAHWVAGTSCHWLCPSQTASINCQLLHKLHRSDRWDKVLTYQHTRDQFLIGSLHSQKERSLAAATPSNHYGTDIHYLKVSAWICLDTSPFSFCTVFNSVILNCTLPWT